MIVGAVIMVVAVVVPIGIVVVAPSHYGCCGCYCCVVEVGWLRRLFFMSLYAVVMWSKCCGLDFLHLCSYMQL